MKLVTTMVQTNLGAAAQQTACGISDTDEDIQTPLQNQRVQDQDRIIKKSCNPMSEKYITEKMTGAKLPSRCRFFLPMQEKMRTLYVLRFSVCLGRYLGVYQYGYEGVEVGWVDVAYGDDLEVRGGGRVEGEACTSGR